MVLHLKLTQPHDEMPQLTVFIIYGTVTSANTPYYLILIKTLIEKSVFFDNYILMCYVAIYIMI